MGLAEKRIISQITAQDQPGCQQQLEQAGLGLTFTIDPASFPENADVLYQYRSYYESHGPSLLVKVLTTIATDSFGKEALLAKIKHVVFKNAAQSPELYGNKTILLKDGTLTVTVSFYGYTDNLYSEQQLKDAIEGLL